MQVTYKENRLVEHQKPVFTKCFNGKLDAPHAISSQVMVVRWPR